MSIDQLTQAIHTGWTRREICDCWSQFSELYTNKHGYAIHRAMITGDFDSYVNREAEVFKRYVRMWGYRNNIPQTQERNH